MLTLPQASKPTKGTTMKRIALALLLAVSTLAHADNFSGEVAFNEVGFSMTQTGAMAGTDDALFTLLSPATVGRRYLIQVTSASDSPNIIHTVAITDGSIDVQPVQVGYAPSFYVTIGNGPGEVRPNEYYYVWVTNYYRQHDTCRKHTHCNVRVLTQPADGGQ
jgi:hypothetical protein